MIAIVAALAVGLWLGFSAGLGLAIYVAARRASDAGTPRSAEPCQSCVDSARCLGCGDRMCADFGPEPRPCGLTCADCPDIDCEPCLDAADDAESERLHQLERDAAAG